MGKGGTRETLENRKALWGNEGDVGKQEGTMGEMKETLEARKALWGKEGRGRHWKTGRHYVETREALENRKALRSRAGRRFIITTDRFNFHPLYTMSRPFFLLVSVAVRNQTSLLCSPLQVPQMLNRSQTPKDGSCHGKKKRKR